MDRMPSNENDKHVNKLLNELLKAELAVQKNENWLKNHDVKKELGLIEED
ncbi:hypothetical protein [Jeotgalibacillus sp. JSM ZJ347]